MPSSSRLTELCRYHYDPLDRQAGCTLTLLQPATLQHFYCKSRLATEVQGAVGTSLFQHDDQLLAQQRHQNDQVDTTLLATDQQRSVLTALDTTRPHPLAYTPYGHRPAESGLLSLLGFNGERPDSVTGHYHLGNGYRQFNPVLMRFNSPDSWSPFGEGGLNAYAYCEGEPVLGSDSSGHFNVIRSFWKGVRNRLGMRTPNEAKKHFTAKTTQTSKTDSHNTQHKSPTNNSLDQNLSNIQTPASISLQEDIAGLNKYKSWIESQKRNKLKISEIISKNTRESEPHSSEHYWPRRTKATTPQPAPEPSYKEFISNAPGSELNNAYSELLTETKHAAFPREIKIAAAMEREIIRRLTS
ncbi:RHS repeat-associated core domain-containing protein [Pseudomonas sp. Irchel s3h17]|uniref:RHS repeat-associated core domain-containing protein n=1 Tax=Pseudomonas sp. Irchel s3h17 TaxID=2009182 RepID=UPI000BA4CF31|nr:RHS repeat-associated core domain-containing protein [Pseudomonas sp. Irchel s3h17]